MRWFYKDLLTGVLAAIIGGAILTGITQRGGWSLHTFAMSGLGSGVAVATWRIVGVTKILVLVGGLLLMAAIAMAIAFVLMPLLLM
jgi:hypothetical protein